MGLVLVLLLPQACESAEEALSPRPVSADETLSVTLQYAHCSSAGPFHLSHSMHTRLSLEQASVAMAWTRVASNGCTSMSPSLGNF